MDISELDDLNTDTIETAGADSDIDVQDITDVQTGVTTENEESPVEPKDIEETTTVDDGEISEDTTDGDEGDSTKVPDDIDTKNLSGIEQYLSKFDIEGGVIDFKDGSRTHFNDLESDKQVEVLSKLHESSTTAVEDKFGLDEDEIGLINYMRQQEGSIDDVINNLALQRAQTYISSQQVKDMDVNKMQDDEVYTSFLLRSNKDITTEQLEKDLETAKKMSNYGNIVTSIKQRMVQDQESELSHQKQEEQNNMAGEIEDQRKQVVDSVSKMDSIDGLSINDGIKNDVLDLILNVDDDGDSLFMTDVFSDPQKLFRAAFWYKNGSDIMNTREDYWKKEKSAAYKRGLKDADLRKKTFSASEVEDRNRTTLHHGDPSETISFDDLYNS